MSYIEENLNSIKKEIEVICQEKNIDSSGIKLVAVTKTIDADKINQVIELGITDIGENKVQEITDKFENIKKGVMWHLIGHLQSNKVKYIIDKVDLIHSVDSISLAKEISLRAGKINRTMDVLIQVNPADEESKFGIEYDETENFIREVSQLSNIRIRGLMTIAPFYEDLEKVRPYFKMMKQKFDSLKNLKKENVSMDYLSMGMTSDYIVAIEEGSNLVRIGTGIFGKRDYIK